MRRRMLLPFLLAVALLGCKRETPAPAPASVPTINAPQAGGRLVRRLETEINTLNYILHTEEDERQVLAYVYDPLIALDQNLQPIPGIATNWEIGDGGRSYTLHLDPRATFSDGTPVKASDVVFTLTKILDEDSIQFAGWFESLDRTQTKALDDRTVRAVFKEARAPQLMAFNIGVMPEHVYGKGDFEKNTNVMGTGPYVVKSRVPGRILLERRADYWREKPRIDSIVFRVIADDAVAWNALMRGDIDVTRVNNDTWWREKDKADVKQRLDFHNTWLLSYNCVMWNNTESVFDDARVRRALAMSFDRKAVIDKLYYGQARPVSGPFVADQWAHNDEVVPIEFNPETASLLFASAGWRDSDGDGVLDRGDHKFEFTMLIPAGNAPSRDQSQILQDALKKIGVRMEITAMDGAAFIDRVLKGNFEAAFLAWNLDPDPDPYTLYHSSQKPPVGFNAGSYNSGEADDLIEKGRLEFDRARRTEIYHQLHDVISRDQPNLFTVQPGAKWAVNRRVQNVGVSKGFGLFLWHPGPHAWWLKQ